jgi:hypothetical protein
LDRQKLMCKAWKTTLKDDASFANIPDLKDGAVITLMGSSEGLVKPVEKQVCIRSPIAGTQGSTRHLLC